jgi:hypothetical protein
MTRFTTETGTIYEYDLHADKDGGQLRVVVRAQPVPADAPTRPGTGEWNPFLGISVPQIGRSCLVHWATTPDGVIQCTRTSRVVSIEN